MGMALGDLAGLSLAGFRAIVEAWNAAHDPDRPEKGHELTAAEERELSAWLDATEPMGHA